MKHKIFIVIASIFFLTGCDYLDQSDASYFDDSEKIFSSHNKARNFLTGIYYYLPTDFGSIGGAMRSSASDNAEHVWDFATVQKFNNGTWNSINALDNSWGYYNGIRAANYFLQEIEGRTYSDYEYHVDYDKISQAVGYYPYEARFLRAFFYLELAKRYGDIPMPNDILLDRENANSVEKSSFQDVIDYIVSECDAIVDFLPETHATEMSQQSGRATKGAVMALKAKALLYAASPLHNPGNDLSKWEAAANAAKDVIDLGIYSLDANYSDVVNNRASSELIFERRQKNENSFEKANFPMGYEGGATGTCPTQNLVDAYEMQATGLAWNKAGSGYDADNPYVGRDPRLNASIIVNNSVWKSKNVEIWNGGANGPQLQGGTLTGYYLKKYLIEAINLDPSNINTKEHVWVLFRLGEIYLNFAEAMNEAYGADADPDNLGMTATAAVNIVRLRSSMPDFPAGMSQSDFRTKLRGERRVELAFEDHRFWDIRRWKIGNETKEIYGMKIENDGGSFSYERFLVENRIYEEKMNLYPIPYNETVVNTNLVQNPGW
jgi:hypothetical protein